MAPHPLTTWNLDPLAILFVAALLGTYFAAIGPLRERFALGDPVARRRVGYFVAGCALLLLIVVSPLDTLARHYLFSAHAVQLFLLITAVAPLLMAGLPEWLVGLLLPLESLREATRGLLFPVIAILAFNGIIIIWHIGPLYEAALRTPWLYDLQLLCILLAGMVDWWPLLTPLDRHTRLANPFQLLYLAVESIPLDLFGVAMLFSRSPFYPTYEHAPRVLGIPALIDQQIAGGIVAIPNNVIDFVLMSVVFFGWIASIDQAQAERERAEADAERAELEAHTLALEAEEQRMAGH
jgi:cytochrome c oxidase assembly factor CtaG